jgi:phosphohistidine phosphatase
MAVTLVLLRHAEAADKEAGRADFDRELTGKGRKQAERVGRQMAHRSLQPDLVVTSPAPRALQTAEIACAAMGIPAGSLRHDESIYENDVPDLLDVARRNGGTSRRLMLVGHNPSLSGLATLLSGRRIDLGKGDAVVLEGPDSWMQLGQATMTVVAELEA